MAGAGEGDYLTRGSSAYRRATFAFFLAGFATFSLLYCVQPLLPILAAEFAVSPAASSLALSLSTGLLAVAILCAAAVSESLGRRGLMFASMAGASILNIAVAFMPDWHMLLVLRALEGFVLGGVPAVAMAYLAEEIEPRGLGYAMGIYVAGTAFGGMSGRVATGFLTEWLTWRPALAVMGGAGLVAAVGFLALLPASRHFVRQRGFDPGYHRRAWLTHARNPALAMLYAIAFLAMGSFVTIYNYTGFRLVAAPYALSQSEIGAMFTVYLFGIVASSLAGGLADRVGRGPVLCAGLLIAILGVAVTLLQPLAAVFLGVVLLTIGFFTAHAVASGWVGRLATSARGHAASLYLLTYYLGSSFLGSAGGFFWAEGRWPAVAGFTLALYGLALLCGLRVLRLARAEASA